MPFDLATNITMPHELLIYYDSISNGWFGLSILLVFFFILLTAFSSQLEEATAIARSLLITSIVGILLFVAGIGTNFMFMVCIAGLILAFILMRHGD